MRIQKLCFTDSLGHEVILRSAEEEDAEGMLAMLRRLSGETPFLAHDPDEIQLTLEQEREFLRDRLEDPRAVMLIAEADGVHAGNASLFGVAKNARRYAHRCQVSIALQREYWNRHIGRAMLEELLKLAPQMGYEQAELEVSVENVRAIRLYASLGFRICGVFPDNMKYADGHYADVCWMTRKV